MKTIEQETNSLKIGLKNESKTPKLKYTLQKHAGSIIESIIRRKGQNISKLARYLKISRCTLYNWFEQDTLPFDVLIRIGAFINHDFSSDFPEIFCSANNEKVEKHPLQNQLTDNEKVDYWIRKYILLLEKYNDTLTSRDFVNEMNTSRY